MATKARIALLITDLDAGGAERNLATLAAGLDRSRFDVAVASLMPPGRIGDELRAAGVDVTGLGMTSRFSAFGFARLSRWLKGTRPDLLHTWLFHANVLGRLAARRRVPRVVSSIRVAEPRRWHLWLERITAPLADCILVNSASLADYAAAHGISREKLRVIPNAVDLTRFGPRRVTAGPPVAVFIGRLTRQKGVDVLLRAAARLPGVRFRIVGEGDARKALEKLARSLGLANVEFAGATGDVPGVLADATLLVLPSRWEGLPNVVLEAMAAGVPVVATNAVGTRDLIADWANGLLAPVDDDAALAECIERVTRDATVYARLVSGGLETASRHSPQAMIEAHQALYLSLLGR